jgi:hypothetical protein
MIFNLNRIGRAVMKRFIPIVLFLAACASRPVLQPEKTLSQNPLPRSADILSIRRLVDYTIRDSVDNIGNLYIKYHSQLPSVLTFVNEDGTVTVCSSDESAKTTYIYEFDRRLNETGNFSFLNEFSTLGAFTKDDEGSYYFFYAERARNQNTENMAVVKYSRAGEKINTYKLKAQAANSFGGIRVPFDAGTCRIELSGFMLAAYFSREMFNGHQASYGFILDKDSFVRIDKGASSHPDIVGDTQMPYSSHSFNQFILPVDGGFLFADHGDAYPRSFAFAKLMYRSNARSNTVRLNAFMFSGGIGVFPTYAQMGGLAKTSSGYIFAGTYGGGRNNARNLFVLSFDENLNACSEPVYLTDYTTDDGHAGHPKIVSLDNRRCLVLWEQFGFSIQSAVVDVNDPTEYLCTFALVINEKGEPVSPVTRLEGVRLNMNDTLRYNPKDGRVYWAINDTDESITLFSMNATLN